MNKKTAILGTVLLASLVANCYAVLVGVYPIRNTGTLSTDLSLAAYYDRDCTMECNGIEWGHVEINVEHVKVVYIKNENTVPISLSAITADWNPTNLTDYVEFTAVPYGTPELVSGEIKELDFYLTIYSGYVGPDDFSFTILVQGTEIEP